MWMRRQAVASSGPAAFRPGRSGCTRYALLWIISVSERVVSGLPANLSYVRLRTDPFPVLGAMAGLPGSYTAASMGCTRRETRKHPRQWPQTEARQKCREWPGMDTDRASGEAAPTIST